MNQKQIDKLKAVHESLETEGMGQFNNKSNAPNVIQEGLEKYNTARKLLHLICEAQIKLNQN